MNRPRRLTVIAASALTAAGIAAGVTASVASAHGDEHHTMKFRVQFAAVAGTDAVSCGTPLTGLGTGSTTAALQDLRVYISDVRLTRTNTTSVPLTLGRNTAYNLTRGGNRVSLIDLENNGTGACTEATPRSTPPSRARCPRASTSHQDVHGSALQAGPPRHHRGARPARHRRDELVVAVRAQVQQDRGHRPGRRGGHLGLEVFVHLSSTGCTGDPASGATVSCSRSNRMAIRLARFDPTTQKIAVDLKALLAGNDITVNKAGAAGCMSGATDPECGGVFGAMRIGWLADGTGSGSALNGGSGQTVFRAMAK